MFDFEKQACGVLYTVCAVLSTSTINAASTQMSVIKQNKLTVEFHVLEPVSMDDNAITLTLVWLCFGGLPFIHVCKITANWKLCWLLALYPYCIFLD